jgi:hypothetical protein
MYACVFMYVCIYVCMYGALRIQRFICGDLFCVIWPHVYVLMYVCMYVHTYVCSSKTRHIHVSRMCMFMRICVRIYAHVLLRQWIDFRYFFERWCLGRVYVCVCVFMYVYVYFGCIFERWCLVSFSAAMYIYKHTYAYISTDVENIKPEKRL